MKRDLENSAPGRVEALPGDASAQLDAQPFVPDPVQKEAVPKVGPITSLEELPAAMKYLERIGAEPGSFKRADVYEQVEGYPKSVGKVHFAEKGVVTVSGKAEAPNAAEADAIAEEFVDRSFLKQVAMLNLPDSPPGVNLSDKNVFVCHNLKGEVVMVHERYQTKDGGKGFVPWTRWSDGEWRKMEPEVMPFYGIPGFENKSTLYIHEGAKAAKRVQAILSGREPAGRFPWFEAVRWGHHIGWIGGVWAIDKSDWAGLAKMGWGSVVIFADNDGGGIEAAAEISGKFECPVYVARFDGNFPDRFDLGDDWPEKHFDETGRYIGPTYRECLQPFDRATDLVPVTGNDGRERLVPFLRRSFINRYRVATETQQVFNVDTPSLGMEKKWFNDFVKSRSDAKDTYGLLLDQPQSVCARRVYRPDRRAGKLIDGGLVTWNGFESAKIEPVSGNVQRFIDYLEHLFPVPGERHEVMRWLATLIARRDIRMHYSLLLVSKTQGVGKSTLGAILRMLLGASNVSFPGQSSFESQFNSWALGKLLIFVNEIYTNGNAKVYDKLKSYVTDDEISINEKNIKEYTIQNWAVFIACSNSSKALFLPDEDRRWLVPTVTETLKDRQWWEALYAWLNTGGIGIILAWAEDFARDHAVKRGERPPSTAAKRAIVSENKSEGRLLARDFGEEFAEMEPAIVRVDDIRSWIATKRGVDIGHAHLEKGRLIIDELEAVEGLTVWKGDDRPKIGGRRGSKASVVFNFSLEVGATWSQVEDRYKSLEELGFEEAF